ncbi:hypothetical protein H1R20_g11125, partial [Candolleomyces eurysporus]
MWSTKRTISAGDTVIIWITRDSIEPLVVTPDAVLHNKFGVYPHNDLIGLPYGAKVQSKLGGRGFVYVLRPTPELWTLALPHRTQILYLADISFVVNWLNIGKGKRVVEAGTGSGSFSHSVARSIGDMGKLFTFEFHEQRAMKAKDEFAAHGLDGIVRLQHRNVCKDGFGEDIGDSIDAVFLDLPAPWEAIPHAKKVLRKDAVARICCFSPCIEQVIRTVTALNDAGFTEITMYETLLRPIDVSSVPKLPSIEDATERLKQAEIKREDKRQKQIKANREKEARDKAKKEKDAGAVAGEKRKHPDGESTTDLNKAEGSLPVVGDTEEGVEPKRVRTEPDQDLATDDIMHVDPSLSSNPAHVPDPVPITLPVISSTSLGSNNKSGTPSSSSPGPGGPKMSVSKALSEVRGHTSYLTFACLIPYEYALKNGNASSAAASRSSADGSDGNASAGGELGNGKTPASTTPAIPASSNTEDAEPERKAD